MKTAEKWASEYLDSPAVADYRKKLIRICLRAQADALQEAFRLVNPIDEVAGNMLRRKVTALRKASRKG